MKRNNSLMLLRAEYCEAEAKALEANARWVLALGMANAKALAARYRLDAERKKTKAVAIRKEEELGNDAVTT